MKTSGIRKTEEIHNEVKDSGFEETEPKPTQTLKEEWPGILKAVEVFEPRRIRIATEEQNEKARKWFEKSAFTIVAAPERYDAFHYEDDFNRLVKSAHPTMSQVASMMICLAPVRHTKAGARLFTHLDVTMKKAERLAAKEQAGMKRKGVL